MCHLCPFIITWVPGPNLDGFFPGYFFEKGNVYYHGYVERSKLINKKTTDSQHPTPSRVLRLGESSEVLRFISRATRRVLGAQQERGIFGGAWNQRFPAFLFTKCHGRHLIIYAQRIWEMQELVTFFANLNGLVGLPKVVSSGFNFLEYVSPSVLLEELVHFNMQQFFSCNHRLSSAYVRFKHDQVPCVGWVMLGC